MRRLVPLFVLVCAALVLPSAARAQTVASAQSSSMPVVTASVQAPSGPTLDDATVGIRHSADQSATTPANVGAPAVRHGDQATTLMIVGGAALLAGAVIGGNAGTIIMVGGAVVGLYGLYLYLQ